MDRTRRIIAICTAWLALVGSTVAVSGWVTADSARAAGTYSAPVVDAIEVLPVAAEVRTGYDRALFRHWVDADGDCQNARQEVLVAEALAPLTYTTTRNCTVATGSWFSYFDAQTFTSASSVSIDHLVALAEAWDSGASTWTAAQRQAFANDLGDDRSLVAVSISSNSSKSDADPATWLPTFERCRYVADWVAVKIRWSLAVDLAEQTALRNVAAGCPATALTVEVVLGNAPTPPPPTVPPTTVPPTTVPPTTVPPTTVPVRLQLSGLSRVTGGNRFADLTWVGAAGLVDLWRGSTRLLRNAGVGSHTNQVTRTTVSATYTVCPAGVARTSPTCSSITLTW